MCRWLRKLRARAQKVEVMPVVAPPPMPDLASVADPLDPNQQLTKNFALREFTRSATASKRGIDNTPTPEMVAATKLLCEHVLQPARDHFGVPFTITSGIRVPALNAAVGGVRSSYHTRGMAADFVVAGGKVPLYEVGMWIQNNCEYSELIWEYGGQWIHVAYDPADLSKETIETYKGGYVPFKFTEQGLLDLKGE